MDDLIEFLFSNGIFVLLILYFIFSAIFRVLRGGGETAQQQAPAGEGERGGQKRTPWANPWDDEVNIDPDPDPREVKEMRERLEQKPPRTPETPSLQVVPNIKTQKPSSWARLSKEEWKRGIILKEILDPPKARRRRGLR
ncbi:hypothetical protein [Desmospora profundinema]|uniref:Uncharacterized protein n=1 Tax=Desmospora profundinema TaxID=1571184 RepID=A0ABU1IJU2_9BACL|nr:hypothetical protein [Desmospora profundinema]MDR6225050.1 hypothetical protein [Desmospora profundinema]